MTEWKLVIHGGAGAMRPVHGDEDHVERARQGLRDALDAGSSVLSDGGSAIDAVEAAVRVLEDDPCFNAGRGSTLNAEGLVELDAAIMDGANAACRRGRGRPDHPRADQPCAHADGARAARLPFV